VGHWLGTAACAELVQQLRNVVFRRVLGDDQRTRDLLRLSAGVKLEDDPLDAAKDMLNNMSMLRKRPTLQEVANTAAFLASDRGSGITASIVNVTSGITAL
jgi:hypothetical protein